jgi:hypothetical protein
MPQCTSATFSRVERAGPSERHARVDTRRRQSAGESARMPPRGAGTTASAAPPSRSDQDAEAPDSGGGGAGTLPRVAEGEVREDLPDDRLILRHGFSGELEGTKVQRRVWPQRDSNPCLVAVTFSPAVSHSSQ